MPRLKTITLVLRNTLVSGKLDNVSPYDQNTIIWLVQFFSLSGITFPHMKRPLVGFNLSLQYIDTILNSIPTL
jgi:hypothetical protein